MYVDIPFSRVENNSLLIGDGDFLPKGMTWTAEEKKSDFTVWKPEKHYY